MPWMFRYGKLGPLVGKRTWGGLIGVSQYPALMDGGNVTSPNFGFFSPDGQWDVENHGVAPDVEVEMDPKPCLLYTSDAADDLLCVDLGGRRIIKKKKKKK